MKSEVRRAVLVAIASVGVAALAHADPRLLEVLKDGNRDAALELIASGANVNERAPDDATALHWAAYNGDADLVKRLIERGADVRATSKYGASAMSLAAASADRSVIEALLKGGADVDSPNAEGQTALMLVARTGRVDTAKLLIKRGAKVNAAEQWRGQTALMWAAAQKQPEMVELLLAHGANPNARSAVNHWQRTATAEARLQYRPSGGLTALLFAAREGCVACVQALAKHKADLDLADPDGITPLLMATLNARFDTAAALLEAGANPNRWDKWGRAPLYATVDYNTLPTGGRPDRPPLDAVTGAQLIERLLQAGANPNMQLKLLPPYRDLRQDRAGDRMLSVGTTALIRAAKTGDVEATRLLLAHGADPNLPNSAGLSPLHAAAGAGSTRLDTRGRNRTEGPCLEVAKLLLAAGADISAVDRAGQTPLYGAAGWGWNELIRYLVANGAKPDAKDEKGFTPVDAAMGKVAGPVRAGIAPDVHQDTAQLLQQLAAATP